MPLKFVIVPIRNLEAAEAELNAFLASHQILSMDRHWVERGAESFWAICIDYLEKRTPTVSPSSQRSRIDYREKLKAEEFDMYSKLRDLRKEIATAEGVPLYNVFNNQQLAAMVEKRAQTQADLEGISGVGDARVEKYGARFLQFLAAHWGAAHETDQPAV